MSLTTLSESILVYMSLHSFKYSTFFRSSLFASIFYFSSWAIVSMFQKYTQKTTLDKMYPMPKVISVMQAISSPSPLPPPVRPIEPATQRHIKRGTVTHITKKSPSFFRVSAFPRSSNRVSKAWSPYYRSIPLHSHSSFQGIVALTHGHNYAYYLLWTIPLNPKGTGSISLMIFETPFSSCTLASDAKNVGIIL